MFEKEADYKLARKASKEQISKVIRAWSAREETLHDEGFKKGAVFGYNKAFVEADKNLKAVVADFNKANEWHYVSEEGHPNKDDIYLTIRKDGLHLGDFCQGGDGDIDCQSWCDYPSEEEIQDDSVIAWKEIVLPELKESKSI